MSATRAPEVVVLDDDDDNDASDNADDDLLSQPIFLQSTPVPKNVPKATTSVVTQEAKHIKEVEEDDDCIVIASVLPSTESASYVLHSSQYSCGDTPNTGDTPESNVSSQTLSPVFPSPHHVSGIHEPDDIVPSLSLLSQPASPEHPHPIVVLSSQEETPKNSKNPFYSLRKFIAVGKSLQRSSSFTANDMPNGSIFDEEFTEKAQSQPSTLFESEIWREHSFGFVACKSFNSIFIEVPTAKSRPLQALMRTQLKSQRLKEER